MASALLRHSRSRLAQSACALTEVAINCGPSGGPQSCSGVQHQAFRGLQLFDVFNKEKAEARRKEIQDEMRRGYFDDFTDLKETGGRMFPVAEGLAPASTAPAFPAFTALRPDGSEQALPPVADAAAAVLVCIAFRAGAEDKLASWSAPFSSAFASSPGARWLELSLVESVVMRMWPFRSMIMRGGAAAAARASAAAQGSRDAAAASAPGVPQEPLFHFGDATMQRQALDMTNRLTGYVYLLDSRGRVRWRASGGARGTEADALLRASERLLDGA